MNQAMETSYEGRMAGALIDQAMIAHLKELAMSPKMIMVLAVLTKLGITIIGVIGLCCILNFGSRVQQQDDEASLVPSIPRQEGRAPSKKMKMDLVIRVLDAKNLPAIPGVINPYVEIRCVKGDPKT